MFNSTPKQLKYTLKAQILGRVPGLYWTARRAAKGVLEPEILLLPRLCDPSKLSLDVGANWGAYTYYASKVSKGVHCFEPQNRLVDVLRRGVGARANVVVHEVALSNRDGFAEIRIPRNDIGYSTIESGNSLDGKADLRLGVKCARVSLQRLDSVSLDGCVGFIKVDVEGHELEVLEGARELLLRDRPKLVVEIEERHRQGAVRAAYDMLSGLGYRAFNLRKGAVVAAQPDSADGQRNWIFVHESDVRVL